MISFLCFYIGLFFTPVTWFFRPVFSFINLLLFAFSVCRISFISDSFMLSFLMLYINPVILSGMAIITAVFLLNPSQRRCHLCFVHHAATRSILQKSFASTAAVLLTLLQLNRNRLLHMNSSLLPMLTRTFHNNRQIICRYPKNMRFFLEALSRRCYNVPIFYRLGESNHKMKKRTLALILTFAMLFALSACSASSSSTSTTTVSTSGFRGQYHHEHGHQ